LYEDYRFTEFDAAKITAEIAEKMQEVKDRSEAVKPAVPMTVNVLLRPHEISELISELAWDLNYASVYSHANLHHQGDDLQKDGDGDKLTVTLRAVVEGSEQSALFDDDGTELTDTCVIENGVVKNYFGASRFGQYLKVEKPSGSLRCAQVKGGTLTEEEMKKQPYLDIVSMSGLQLDLYNDYIGGEIRLAYYFDGEKTVPVTGITMSAKLSDALAGMKLSGDTTVSGAYEGPGYMMLKGIAVL
jgi:predicted Zn-dependent protease